MLFRGNVKKTGQLNFIFLNFIAKNNILHLPKARKFKIWFETTNM